MGASSGCLLPDPVYTKAPCCLVGRSLITAAGAQPSSLRRVALDRTSTHGGNVSSARGCGPRVCAPLARPGAAQVGSAPRCEGVKSPLSHDPRPIASFVRSRRTSTISPRQDSSRRGRLPESLLGHDARRRGQSQRDLSYPRHGRGVRFSLWLFRAWSVAKRETATGERGSS